MSSDGIANLDPLATAFVFDAIDLGMQYAELEANGFIPFATILGKDGSKTGLETLRQQPGRLDGRRRGGPRAAATPGGRRDGALRHAGL